MASSNSLYQSEYELLCSICLDVFTDPVTTPCGHNFCMTCIKEVWDTSSYCQCPICKRNFLRRPDLQVSAFSPGRPAKPKKPLITLPSNGGELVFCGVCKEKKCKAVKSCLICVASFCKTHLEPHEKVPLLKEHKLINPVKNLDNYICQKHKKHLEMFCRNDQTCVCQQCILERHRNHNTVPIEEESKVKKTNLGTTQAKVAQMIQDRQMKIKEIKHSVELNKRNTEKNKADSIELFKDLISRFEKIRDELLKEMDENHNAAKLQAKKLIKDLEQEMVLLKRRSTELEKICNTEDHLHLLQRYPYLCRPPPTNNWTDVRIQPSLNVRNLREALSQHQKCIDEEIKKTVSLELKMIQQYAVDVILDPDTAHPNLILSNSRTQVTDGCTEQKLPDNPGRFDTCIYILGKEGFSSGRFYYKVQVSGKPEWYLGVTRQSSNRKGDISVSPKDGYWTVCLGNKTDYQALDSPSVLLSLKSAPQKVGVFVDYDEGLVSFYDVENESHIYSFTGQTFTEKLYPVFCPGLNDDGENSAPLIICPVNHL